MDSGQRSEDIVRVLELDSMLMAAVPPDSREAARASLQAAVVTIEPGAWDPSGLAAEDALGLLPVKGLMIRNVRLAGTLSAEILGAGDILRPWDDDTSMNPIPADISWSVIEPTTLAVLDRRWIMVAGRWPDLAAEIHHRLTRRSRWLAVLNAITNTRGLETRILLLFWHLAGIWGRVTPSGTVMPFNLTHEVIADLIGARRPSVTTALSQMEGRALLERTDDGWLLYADPPSSEG